MAKGKIKKKAKSGITHRRKILTFEEGSVLHHSLTLKHCATSLNDYATFVKNEDVKEHLYLKEKEPFLKTF